MHLMGWLPRRRGRPRGRARRAAPAAWTCRRSRPIALGRLGAQERGGSCWGTRPTPRARSTRPAAGWRWRSGSASPRSTDGARRARPAAYWAVQPSVDDELAAGHERRLVRGEVQDAVGDLVGLAEPAERDPRQHLPVVLRIGAPPLGHRGSTIGRDGPSWRECPPARTGWRWPSSGGARRPWRPGTAGCCCRSRRDPSWDEMLTIEPPPAWRMAGMAARVPRNTPLALTSMTRSHSFDRRVLDAAAGPPTPALFTSTSSRPKRSIVRLTARSQSRLVGHVEPDEQRVAARRPDVGLDRPGPRPRGCRR